MLARPTSGLELGGRDGWTIIIGVDVAFTPTSVPPDIGVVELERRAG